MAPTHQFCVNCGTLRGEGAARENGNGGGTGAAGFNEIEFEGRNHRFRAKVSNEGMQHLSDPFNLFLHAYTGVPVRRSRTTTGSDVNNGTPPLPFSDGEGDTNSKEIDVTPQPRGELPPNTEGSEEARLKELFREREGQLCLEEPQLKAAGKQDYAERLTYLYLFYQEKVANKESVPRTALDEMLAANMEVDWRTPAWIKSEPAIVKRGENVFLNSEGRRAARIRLAEAFDPTRPAGWLPGETTAGSNHKNAGGEKATPAAKGGNNKTDRNSVVNKEWVPKWNALKLDVDGHGLFSKRSKGEQGMLGLWAIRKALGEKDGKVVSRRHLADFLYHAFEIDADESGIYGALKAKKMKDFVLNTGGTSFQLLPPGTKEVEKIIAAGKGTSKKH